MSDVRCLPRIGFLYYFCSNFRAKDTAKEYTLFDSTLIKTGDLGLSREGLILIALMSGSDFDNVRLTFLIFVLPLTLLIVGHSGMWHCDRTTSC